MNSDELLLRYLMGDASDEDVKKLEQLLRDDEGMQDEFLRQTRLDALLRQEAQSASAVQVSAVNREKRSFSLPGFWKWAAAISTLSALIFLSLLVLSFPPSKSALAYPSLGDVTIEVVRTEHNIWSAAANDDLDAISGEVNNNVAVDEKSSCGLSPLHYATLYGHSDAVELLLSLRADVSLTDSEGNTALHIAAFLGHTNIVRVLLKAGADPETRNKLGFSSMDNVAIRWSPGLEAYYRKLGKELNTSLDLDRIKAERLVILGMLDSANPARSNRVPAVSIWQAAMTGNTSAVEQHVSAGTDLNATVDIASTTPLMIAAIYGQPEVAKILIASGADLERRNKSGGTALHVACFFCRLEVVNLLLDAQANSSAANKRGLTPLDIVTMKFDESLDGAYKHTYDAVGLTYNPEDVQRARKQIAENLQNRIQSSETIPTETP